MRARHLLLLLVACSACSEKKAEPVKSELDVARDDARVVLETHCGECHIPGYPTAREGALRIFNLMETDWSARMSEAQLKNAIWRLGEPLDMHGNERIVPEKDQATFKTFVELELRRRNSASEATP